MLRFLKKVILPNEEKQVFEEYLNTTCGEGCFDSNFESVCQGQGGGSSGSSLDLEPEEIRSKPADWVIKDRHMGSLVTKSYDTITASKRNGVIRTVGARHDGSRLTGTPSAGYNARWEEVSCTKNINTSQQSVNFFVIGILTLTSTNPNYSTVLEGMGPQTYNANYVFQ